ncbi:glycosyltransferase family 2 protein [Seonamhaeicola aphaedonensis]|uniref:GT2 family glycosyltransferase n=1 Tax=Seonamhaeicola aphaedonensis TaxID=1461338 RepID=A0A3D9HFZ3_9FLAO|nr:glycosyltransferase family A protein [Seonamhaeicola aphaedonensis]RED48355.1 GT2 family glycosyltransferase [Seonamhaeicola aphaedonensis]
MLFQFLKYLQPTHYFTVLKNNGTSIFPDVNSLSEDVLKAVTFDNRYTNDLAKQYDASWQLIHKGYIGHAKTIETIETLPLMDEYRFIRKYFNPTWVFYVLVIRVLSFYNPFKEFKSWYSTKHIKRVPILKTPMKYKDWEYNKAPLIEEKPMVSVIIPTLNRYAYLKDVLKDLEVQDYNNFEVLVVDQSQPFQERFYKDFHLNLKVQQQRETALWQARNWAIKHSKGDYLLFFDDDSRVAPDWIQKHLKCLDFFNADVSSGVSISKVGDKVPEHYSFFRLSDQLDTGNVMIKKAVFKETGLFDRQFEKQRMGDGEFGMRAYLNGFKNISNPQAKRLHLKVGTGGLRTMGSWDAFRTNHVFQPKPIPSVLYFFRSYFGNTRARLALLRLVPISIMPYRFKKNKGMLILGVFVCILILPLVVFQVCKSWRLSSIKIKQGPLIDTLDAL